MTDLHDRISAALDREQAESYACDCEGFAHDHASVARRVEADRRVLTRHALQSAGGARWCKADRTDYPCDDLLDLADRVDVQP